MIIDLLIIYREPKIFIESKAANFSEERLATIGLSRNPGEEAEVVESIGDYSTSAELQQLALTKLGDTTTIYRVINPFSRNFFEAAPAAKMIEFYCNKARILIHPHTWGWRGLFHLTKVDLKVQFPHYNFLPEDKREEFEKELRAITRQFQIIT